MTLKEKMRLLQRAQELIRRKATGTPRELANRLEISERTWYRILEELKDTGLPVVYCKERQSYYFEEFDPYFLSKNDL